MYYYNPIIPQLQFIKDSCDYVHACRIMHNPFKSDFEKFHACITIGQFWNKYVKFN